MTSPYVPPEELLQFLAVLADGELTEEQERRLAEILRQDPQARTYYLDSVALWTSLQWEYTAAAEVGESGASAAPLRSRRARFLLMAAVGLGGFAAGLLLALLLFRQPSPQATGTTTDWAVPTDGYVAVLVQGHGVEWGETSLPTQPGASLLPGWLRLKSGAVQIQFYSGANVILEGPTDLQLISPREAYCARGKLRATVPPQAQGFTIGSPKLELVDSGAVFGLRVEEGDKTEVHVFDGTVNLYDAGSGRAEASRKELTKGHGFRLDESGAGNPIDSDSSAFHTAQQLVGLTTEEAHRRYQAWLVASERLRQDPRLLLYYTFQTAQPWDHILPDRVKGRQGKPWDGVIVGCEWSNGRWPGKQALEFKRPSDRVRIHVPGTYQSLTYLAWVRVDAFDQFFSALMLTDGYDPGAPHWQLTDLGRMRFGISGSLPPGLHDSPAFLRSDRLGKWLQLVTVYNHRSRTVTHYVDGRPVSQQGLHFDAALRIGDAEIGNWGRTIPISPEMILRNFNGRIDEFALFQEALSPEEIARLYEFGKVSP